MAEELKYKQWDALKHDRRKHLMRYPWHRWLNGSTWLLLQGEDYDLSPEEFQAYVLTLARTNKFRVKTMVTPEGHGVYVKKLRPHTDRFSRIRSEWEARWESQKKLGIDEWWVYPERLDDLRERRRKAQDEREMKTGRVQASEGPYIPGWERKLLAGELPGGDDNAGGQ